MYIPSGIDYTGNITCLAQKKSTKDVYMLTKDGISDKCEAIRESDAGFLLAEGRFTVVN